MWLPLLVWFSSCWAVFVLFLAALVGLNRQGNRESLLQKKFLVIILCFFGSLSFNACTSSSLPQTRSGASTLSTKERVQIASQHATSAASSLNLAISLIEQVQSGKVTVEVALPQIHEKLLLSKSELDQVTTALPTAVKTAEKDEKDKSKLQTENQTLRANDPTAKKANEIGILLLCLSAIAIGLGIWKNIQPAYIGGFVGVGVSLILFISARIILALNRIPDWSIYSFILAIIGGSVAVYFIVHRKVKTDKAKDDAKYIPISLTPPAEDKP